MSTQQAVNAAVREAYDAGLCIIPPREDGSKAPAVDTWKEYQAERPSLDLLREIYRPGRYGLGTLGGAVAGQLEVFECETEEIWKRFRMAMADGGYEDLVEKAEAGYLERAPRGGVHYLWRTEVAGGNTKLAMTADFQTTLIEVKASGGYCILAPSFGPVHPTGLAYERLSGSFATIPYFEQEERDIWYRVAATFDLRPRVDDIPYRPSTDADDLSLPGNDFNARGSWRDDVLLPAGWTHLSTMGDRDGRPQEFWRRPGKDRGNSAVLHPHAAQGNGLFVCFSTSTPFETEEGYSKFRAYALLHHGGDFAAAARALRFKGYGQPREQKPPPPSDPSADGWFPLVIDLNRIASERQPSMFLNRVDKVPMLYEGETNYIFGSPGSLKTWLTLAAVKEYINQGRYVAYYDFDRNRESKLVGRLRGIGLNDDVIVEFFRYACPNGPAGIRGGNVDVLASTLSAYDLVVFDSVNNGARLDGLTMSNEDVALWFRLPEAFTDKGTTALLLDHVTKNVENRRWPVGAQHKMAATSGAAIRVELVQNPIQKPGSERDGLSRLFIEKDRHGFLPTGYGECVSVLRLGIIPGEDQRQLVLGIPSEMTLEAEKTRACQQCGTTFPAATKRAKYCSDTCRQRARRESESVSPNVDEE